jgi:hypothetical protein
VSIVSFWKSTGLFDIFYMSPVIAFGPLGGL